MNNCGTCKHWGSIEKNVYRNEGPGGQKRCGRIVDGTNTSNNELQNERAYTEDGEDYYSAIMTKPDFGCVLWEPKQ